MISRMEENYWQGYQQSVESEHTAVNYASFCEEWTPNQNGFSDTTVSFVKVLFYYIVAALQTKVWVNFRKL